MVLCLIFGCGTKSGRDEGAQFSKFPELIANEGEEARKLSELRRERWISAISRDDLTESHKKHGRVCGKHFVSGKAAKRWDKFNVDWVPSLCLGHEKKLSGKKLEEKLQSSAKRDERRRLREKLRVEAQDKLREQLRQEVAAKKQKINEPGIQVEDIGIENIFDIYMETGVATQTEEFDYLFVTAEKPFEENWFAGDDEKVAFYTGISGFDVLMTVFRHVSPHVNRKSMTLSKFQEFILTLMKLRLNAPMQDLAYRFGVSRSTVSRIFLAWMIVMDCRLVPLIVWPDRADLWRTMPQCFQFSFGNRVTVIIDCFEVFTNRPSNLYARAQTYSSYKSHSTVKILIGITPQGSISFVSQAWGGRTSDKHLTDNCGILNKLVPGDLVMADRGFTIHESVLMQRAELVIPAFTKGRDQLDPIDVEKTRGIANVRIHVERVIGLLRRKYTILSSILPIEFLACDKRNEENAKPMIDRIITVTSALTNLSPGIVPFD